MAIIYSYPQIGELATGDTIAISDASNGNKTKSVTIGQLDGRYYLSSNPNSYTSNLGVVQSLTTNNSSGTATLVSGVLNIPQYSSGSGSITEITTTAPITGGPITTTGTIGITQASSSANGYLSSTDWNTFNNKTSFPGFGTTPGTALEGNTVIPAAYTNADVDAHLNISTAGNNEVLSWTGSDYDWVAQSGGGGGVTSIIAGTGIGVNQSTGDVTITNTGSVTGAYTSFTRTFTGNELVNAFNGNVSDSITLISVPSGNIGFVERAIFITKGASTGTINYNANGSLYVFPTGATSSSSQVRILNSALNSGSDNIFNSVNTGGGNSVAAVAPVGGDIVLGRPSGGSGVAISQGDRDVVLYVIYKIINF